MAVMMKYTTPEATFQTFPRISQPYCFLRLRRHNIMASTLLLIMSQGLASAIMSSNKYVKVLPWHCQKQSWTRLIFIWHTPNRISHIFLQPSGRFTDYSSPSTSLIATVEDSIAGRVIARRRRESGVEDDRGEFKLSQNLQVHFRAITNCACRRRFLQTGDHWVTPRRHALGNI